MDFLIRQGDGRQAATFFEESLGLYRELERQNGIAECLAGLAGVAGVEGTIEVCSAAVRSGRSDARSH